MIGKRLIFIVLLALAASNAFAADEVFEFKGRVGFISGEDKIVNHRIIDDGRKIVVIGSKNLQVWDVENQKLISQTALDIPQFNERGIISTYLLLGIPKFLDWRPYVIDPKGRWIITAEKVGQNLLRSAVVRDLSTLKTIAVMDTPNVSIEYLVLDDASGRLLTQGQTEKTGAFGTWETEKFTPLEIITIPNYKWHQKIGDGSKMLVGTGDTKVVWTAMFGKQGNAFSLRDVKTGAVEKEFTVENVKPDSAFFDTVVSLDEKILISKREGRVIVWDINGDGKPLFEVTKPTPKSEFDIEAIVDTRYIVVFVDDELQIFDVAKKGQRILTVSRPSPKEDLDFTSIVNKRYALVRVQARLHIYDLETGALRFAIKTENDPKDRVELRAISRDERFFAIAEDERVAVYDIEGDGKPLYEIRRDSPKERFPTVQFFDDRGLMGVARLNNSENKAPKTEFYNVKTGKLAFTASIEIYGNAKFSSDNNLLYQVRLGGVDVWNAATGRSYVERLQTYTEETTDPSTGQTTQGASYNWDDVIFSPDLKFFIKTARKYTAVYDTATGQRVQLLSTPVDPAASDKKKSKDGKIGRIGWVKEGELLYAEEPFRFFGQQRTLSLWTVKK